MSLGPRFYRTASYYVKNARTTAAPFSCPTAAPRAALAPRRHACFAPRRGSARAGGIARRDAAGGCARVTYDVFSAEAAHGAVVAEHFPGAVRALRRYLSPDPLRCAEYVNKCGAARAHREGIVAIYRGGRLRVRTEAARSR